MKEVEIPKEDAAIEGTESALSRLIAEQSVKPIYDLDQLAALWPADDDPDALMNFVLAERQARVELKPEQQQSK